MSQNKHSKQTREQTSEQTSKQTRRAEQAGGASRRNKRAEQADRASGKSKWAKQTGRANGQSERAKQTSRANGQEATIEYPPSITSNILRPISSVEYPPSNIFIEYPSSNIACRHNQRDARAWRCILKKNDAAVNVSTAVRRLRRTTYPPPDQMQPT